MGQYFSYPAPEDSPEVFEFNEYKLHLKFHKDNFIQKNGKKQNWSHPNKIIVYFYAQSGKVKLGETSADDFVISLPEECRKHIIESKRTEYSIGFYGVWTFFTGGEKKCSIKFYQKMNLHENEIFLRKNKSITFDHQIDNLLKKIQNYPKDEKDLKLNIMLFGFTKAGKSSFINSILYALFLNKSQKAYVFVGEIGKTNIGNTGTKSFKEIRIFDWLSIWDTPGFQIDPNGEITEFWTYNSIKRICTEYDFSSNTFPKKDIALKNQVHSAILFWKWNMAGNKTFFSLI